MIEPGQEANQFELTSTAGGEIDLMSTLDGGPTVLIFFRGGWCSFCAETLQSYSELAYDMWRHQDVDILPITGDTIPSLIEMRDRFDLSVQLLSDPDLLVTKQYTRVEENDTYGDIPVPATYVIDQTAEVRFRQIATRPDERVFANYVRLFIKNEFRDIYPDSYY